MENRINKTIELQKAVANGKPDFLSQTVYLQLNDYNQKKCISLSITAAMNFRKIIDPWKSEIYPYLAKDNNLNQPILPITIFFVSKWICVTKISIASGDEQLVRELINAGANISALDKYGYAPIHIACENGEILFRYFLYSLNFFRLCNDLLTNLVSKWFFFGKHVNFFSRKRANDQRAHKCWCEY